MEVFAAHQRSLLNRLKNSSHVRRAVLLWVMGCAPLLNSADWQESLREPLRGALRTEIPSLLELYRHLHAHPELSFAEKDTSQRMSEELQKVGWEVTRNVGGHGVVGVLRHGEGPTVLVRTDMDALPVREQTGLPYASKVQTRDEHGTVVHVMHACGHDIHMTVWTGTARLLARFKDHWNGTIVMIAQPAEERGSGARLMLKDRLFEKFPRPDLCLALHVAADLPTGSVGLTEGFALANVDMVDVTIPGVGGHGAWPHAAKDPVVLAAQAILAYQTIVSRETEPGKAAVVTVGSVHGGTKHNIIPDEVKLELTLRSFSDTVRSNTLASLERITRHLALAAGLPADRSPVLRVRDEYTSALFNDPAVTRDLRTLFTRWLPRGAVVEKAPVMGGEDFSEFGRTRDRIPICLFWLGGVDPARHERSTITGERLPPLHSAEFAPVPEPTVETGVLAMTAAVLRALNRDDP
jgi:hippurate hydrolase